MFIPFTHTSTDGLIWCLFKAGDRVGVRRRADGTLDFYVNGIDQGQAATNVPENVFGVVDLYGQAAQATIIDRFGKCWVA